MATAIENRVGRHGLALGVGAIAAAYLATRLALTWRFPWFVDETTFASFARDVHHSLGGNFFIAESDKKGLLPSWLGAGLIAVGIEPVTAMRLLAAAGAALAALCGGLLMRRLYDVRAGLVTAALIALGPYFLVTSSVGIYDALVTGFVTAAVLVSLLLAARPRLWTALLLGACLGAGGLTKPTVWVAAVVLPATLTLFDFRSPELRRRLALWAGHAALALALGFAITSVARFSPLYDTPIAVENHRELGLGLGAVASAAWSNIPLMLVALIGYLTLPGVVLAVVGAVSGWRRHRPAAAVLLVWTATALASAAVLPLWPNPRYFAAAMVPLAGFVALGSLATSDRLLRTWRKGPSMTRIVGCAIAIAAVVPALLFDAQVLIDPAHASYPGLDQDQYITRPSGLEPLAAIAGTIERQGGPYPVRIDAGPYPHRIDVGPWGLDLLLNGSAAGSTTRYRVFAHGTPAQLASARFLVSDGERSDAAPRPGFRLVRRIARSDRGAVIRLYERERG